MKEIRSITSPEFRIEPDSRKIEGYALLFNVESQDLGGFTEIIRPEAMNGVLEKSDILALYNHDEKDVLARSTQGKGTLNLSVDDKGLKYSFDAPKTAIGDEVLDAIIRGDLRNSSFAFTVTSDGQKWEKRDKAYVRNITQFDELFDVSPVYRPAYLDTTVAARELKVEVEVKVIEGEDLETTTPEPEMPAEMPVEEPNEDNLTTDKLEMNSETEEPETSVEMIEIVYDNETYSVPFEILRDYINNRKFEHYVNELEDMIKNLKK